MRLSTSVVGLAVLWLGTTSVVHGWCADDPAKPKDVKVSVVTIIASETDKTIDPRLEAIAKEIQKVHPKLVGFRMEKMTCKSIAVNASETYELLAEQKATITVKKITEDNAEKVQLTVKPPSLGEITYTTTCGKFFPIVTRYQPKKKEVLILAVRCQSCSEK